MKLLGQRIRRRRRNLLLHQKDVVGKDCASFLSKVENGVTYPSVKNLKDWSKSLKTTPSELMGDHLLLEAAKHTILLPKKCEEYLNRLPLDEVTSFLRTLSASVVSVSIPVPEPPEDAEMQYLTAQVYLKKNLPQNALHLVNQALNNGKHPLLHIKLLHLLYRIYEKLSLSKEMEKSYEELLSYLETFSYYKVIQDLPAADAITTLDLDLLKLSILVKELDLI